MSSEGWQTAWTRLHQACCCLISQVLFVWCFVSVSRRCRSISSGKIKTLVISDLLLVEHSWWGARHILMCTKQLKISWFKRYEGKRIVLQSIEAETLILCTTVQPQVWYSCNATARLVAITSAHVGTCTAHVLCKHCFVLNCLTVVDR